MSLFSELSEGKIIDNPAQLKQRRRELTVDEKKQKEKIEREKKKKELSKEEYDKRYQAKWRSHNKRKKHELYEKWIDDLSQAGKEFLEEYLSQIEYKGEKEYTVDEKFIEKYKEEDTDWEGRYRYSRRASPLTARKRNNIWRTPVRIAENYDMNILMRSQLNVQNKVYNLVMPHINEIEKNSFKIAKGQKVTARPMWNMNGKILELAEESKLPKHQICEITRGIMDGTYITSEVFLGRISRIFGEVIVTSMGHMFKIALENNLERLTEDTVDEIRQQRLNYKSKKDKCPIYRIYNAHLIRLPAWKICEDDGRKNYNHWLYYVVPGKDLIYNG